MIRSIQLVSFDLDYTLLNSDHVLADKHIKWLQAISQDHVLVFASGRPLEAMIPIAAQVGQGVVDYLISNNGCENVNAQGDIFYEVFLQEKLVRQVVKQAFQYGVHPHFYHGPHIVGFYDSPFIRRDEKVTKLPITIESNVDNAIADKAIHKLIIMGEPVKMAAFHTSLSSFADINPILAKPYFMEVPPKGIHKGYALGILTEKLGMTMDQVMSFGDSFNDVEMLRDSGLGLAVANAMPGVKQAADRVLTISCDDNLAEVAYGLLDDTKRSELLATYSHLYKEIA